MDNKNYINIQVNACARCGGDHNLAFRQFERKSKYTHWAMCPQSSEPIVLKIVEVDTVNGERHKQVERRA